MRTVDWSQSQVILKIAYGSFGRIVWTLLRIRRKEMVLVLGLVVVGLERFVRAKPCTSDGVMLQSGREVMTSA